jgi:hypothetical protein
MLSSSLFIGSAAAARASIASGVAAARAAETKARKVKIPVYWSVAVSDQILLTASDFPLPSSCWIDWELREAFQKLEDLEFSSLRRVVLEIFSRALELNSFYSLLSRTRQSPRRKYELLNGENTSFVPILLQLVLSLDHSGSLILCVGSSTVVRLRVPISM